MAVSGEEFKKLYPNTTFYKLTNDIECHNGFQFNDGLNIDHVKFDPTDECKGGGLYFTELNNVAMWITYIHIKYIREVEILDDSLIYIEKNKFKTNKFVLKERCLLKDFPFLNDMYFCLLAVQQNGLALRYVHEQTNGICLIAVQQNSSALEYVKDQTDELCLAAVQKDWMSLQYVKDQTYEICLAAVQQYGTILHLVNEQTNDICLSAVQQNGLALHYVKNQTEEICLLAVQQNGWALRYVVKQNDNICKFAVKQNGAAFQYVKEKTCNIYLLSVLQTWFYL
jgi:hypothetical protein